MRGTTLDVVPATQDGRTRERVAARSRLGSVKEFVKAVAAAAAGVATALGFSTFDYTVREVFLKTWSKDFGTTRLRCSSTSTAQKTWT